jgi:hypothetical protein
MVKAEYVVDNLGAARGRLPDAAMRQRTDQFIDVCSRISVEMHIKPCARFAL